ncbi:MAG: hypothetical protein HON23_05910 [Rickettsiales bacterium]|jgi:hypothetical protein|nr:hypothetical protein [Rickettsiales bacterium]
MPNEDNNITESLFEIRCKLDELESTMTSMFWGVCFILGAISFKLGIVSWDDIIEIVVVLCGLWGAYKLIKHINLVLKKR